MLPRDRGGRCKKPSATGRPSFVPCLDPSLPVSLICHLPLSLSSPSQNLNLRPSPIWLCGAENGLRTWPPRGRVRAQLRSRNEACRTPSGRLFGPIGRLFRPSGHGLFRVASGAASPCIGQACGSEGRHQLPGKREAPAFRRRLRLCLHLWLRRPIGPQVRIRRLRRGLRAWRFGDISTQPPHRNTRPIHGALVALAIGAVVFALGAFAISSAPAPQLLAGSTALIALGATAIASALATHRLLASALASQRFGVERLRAWRPA